MLTPEQFRSKYKRTVSAKPIEIVPCRTKPGVLIPGDAERIRDHVAPELSLSEFGEHYLEASEGSLMQDRRTGRRYRLPTLVPKQNPDGSCVFLTAMGRCGCHAVSPAGCAYFDLSMSRDEGNRRSADLHEAIMSGDDQYEQLHAELTDAGQTAKPLAQRCKAMNDAIKSFEKQAAKPKYKKRKKR